MPYFNHVDAVFARYYTDAYYNWQSGNRAAVPRAWLTALDAAKNKKVSGTGDLLLGMNAHINRDLPYVMAASGLVAPDGILPQGRLRRRRGLALRRHRAADRPVRRPASTRPWTTPRIRSGSATPPFPAVLRVAGVLGSGASERSIAGPHAELIHRALAGESTVDSEIAVIRADGSQGIVSLSAEPVRDAGGEIVAAVATLFDLTEHRQREEALAFLAEASVVLTETLDLQHTLTELVELAVPRLADWCTIDMLDHGEIRNVGVAHADPETARLARRLHARRPVRAQASSGVSAALATGRSQLIQDVPAWLARQETPDEELLTMARVLGVRSSIVAPLAGHGRVFGALDARDDRVRPALLGAGPGGRRGPRAPRRARDRERAALRRRARHRARAAAEPAARHADAAARHRGRRALPPGRRGRRGRRRLLRLVADRRRATSSPSATSPGHGPAAAALTSLTRQAMRVVSRYEQSPGRILAVVNDTIRAQSAPEQFCTAALAVLAPDRATATR